MQVTYLIYYIFLINATLFCNNTLLQTSSSIIALFPIVAPVLPSLHVAVDLEPLKLNVIFGGFAITINCSVLVDAVFPAASLTYYLYAVYDLRSVAL